MPFLRDQSGIIRHKTFSKFSGAVTAAIFLPYHGKKLVIRHSRRKTFTLMSLAGVTKKKRWRQEEMEKSVIEIQTSKR